MQQQQMTMDQLSAMRGVPVYDSDGEEIGTVEEIFYDQQTREPEWIGVGTGFFGTKRVLVPTAGASATGDGVTVRYSKENVKDSPDIDSDEISQETEQELYAHYGLEYSERRSETGLPEGPRGAGGTTGEETAVTRHEEELAVGKRDMETGRARLRKWVETEPVQEDVELRRETARVEREPIDQPVSEGAIGEEEIEVPLRGEEAVAEKRTVAKERIGIEKDVETERETVGDQVRKERVEVEGDVKGRKGKS
jgi:uncharacterized protein (TIGR02271 family)